MRWFFDREDGLVKPATLDRRRFVFLFGLGAAGVAADAGGGLLRGWKGQRDVVYFDGVLVGSRLRPAGELLAPEASVVEILYGPEHGPWMFSPLAFDSIEWQSDPSGEGAETRVMRVSYERFLAGQLDS